MQVNLIIFIFLVISVIGLFVYFLWSTLLIIHPKKSTKQYTSMKNLEEYSLFLLFPVLNEKNVIEKSINFVLKETKIEYDFDVELIAIDDASDDGTYEILKRMGSIYKNLHIVSRKLPNARQGKGFALNNGLTYLKSLTNGKNNDKIIIGVLDADSYIEKKGYNKIISAFKKNPNLDMLQTSIRINSSKKWLQIMQDIEFQSCNYLIQNLRVNLDNVAASGNGQFIRLSSLPSKDRVWDNSLLEDFEFSTRLLLSGKDTLFLENTFVYQQAVDTIKAFFSQRTRWAQGGIECIEKYGREILKTNKLKKSAKIEMFFYMFLPFLTGISAIGHIISFLYLIFTIILHKNIPFFSEITIIALLIYSSLISISIGYTYYNRTNVSVIYAFSYGFTIPIYTYLMVPVCYLAIKNYIIKNNTWSKTDHDII